MPTCRRCHGTGKEPDWVTFGIKMRWKRTARKMSLQDVGAAVGCSKAYISDLERGNRGWEGDTARKVIAFLGGDDA